MSDSSSLLPRDATLRLAYLYGGSVRYQPGEILGPRLLTDYELVLLIEGHAHYESQGLVHPLEPGSVLLTRPGFRETYRWDEHVRTRHAFFHFGIDAIPHSWPDPDQWPVARRRPDPAVSGLFRSILERCHRRGDPPTGSPPHLDTRLVATLIELLFEEPEEATTNDETERPEPVARALKWMRHLLEERPTSGVTLPELARHAGVSPKHLCRVFKQSVGHPPMETLRLLRLQLAVALLVRSNLTIKEIAECCGFTDPLYFSRCFSTTLGRPPRQVRHDLKQGTPPPPNPLPVDITPRVHW